MTSVTQIESFGPSTTTSKTGITVTAGAAYVYGAWTQIAASIAKNAVAIVVCIEPNAGFSGGTFVVDIGLGASPPATLIPNIVCQSPATDGALRQRYYFFWVSIPSGSEIRARAISTISYTSGQVSVFLAEVPGNDLPVSMQGHSVENGGANVTAGAVNTKGAYSALIASTAKNAIAIALSFRAQTLTASTILADIAFGAAGSEVVKMANFPFAFASNVGPLTLFSPPIPYNIPAGTRISVRIQASTAASVVGVDGYVMEP